MESIFRIMLSLSALLGLAVCSDATPQHWVKPKRVIAIPADVRKALLIASSSSILSKYGPVAGVLAELLPKDLNELSGELKDVDWSQDTCIWTFDTAVNEVSAHGPTLIIRPTHEEGTGIRLWFFEKGLVRKVKKIQFE